MITVLHVFLSALFGLPLGHDRQTDWPTKITGMNATWFQTAAPNRNGDRQEFYCN
jgi:hypothetical protein